ncbi:MAG TPA: amidohydrolase family protein [Xanthobacteraceae bacterium]|nr:amidohydrolase family protein [Xanthobacteraceae bacterium]
MATSDVNRRTVLAMVGASAADAVMSQAQAQQVPWSSGTAPAKTKAPPNATDCHHHIYSARFKIDPNSTLRPGDASVVAYRLLQKRIGTSRNVIVQPSTYGVFNDGLIEALGECGPTARGVAVVNASVTDDELKRLDAARVRGVRFNLATPGGATNMDMLEPIAKRIAPMGWHVQFNMSADMTLAAKDVLNRLPCQIVFDHLAHMPEPVGTGHPAFAVVVDLLQKSKAWVKLSGAYADTKVGPPTYADSTAVAQAYVKAAPERLVWGSDWPHPSEQGKGALPDDAVLFDLLAEWAPDEAVRNRILVDNPAKLYSFS